MASAERCSQEDRPVGPGFYELEGATGEASAIHTVPVEKGVELARLLRAHAARMTLQLQQVQEQLACLLSDSDTCLESYGCGGAVTAISTAGSVVSTVDHSYRGGNGNNNPMLGVPSGDGISFQPHDEGEATSTVGLGSRFGSPRGHACITPVTPVLLRDAAVPEKSNSGHEPGSSVPVKNNSGITIMASNQASPTVSIQLPAGGSSMSASAESLGNEDEKAKDRAHHLASEAEEEHRRTVTATTALMQHEMGPLRKMLKSVVDNPSFDLVASVVIMTNVVFIGAQVQYAASRVDEPAVNHLFKVVQYAFAAVFALELVLRMLVNQLQFFLGEDLVWNIMDFTIVIASLVDVVIEVVTNNEASANQFSLVRVMRVLRIARIIRILRLVRFFRHLRILIFSVLNTLRSAAWAMMLLCIILYAFATVFTQAVTEYSGGSKAERDELWDLYGTLPRSCFTLFLTISAGVSWGEVVKPLSSVSGFYVVLYIIYVCFVLFAVLNVVTGVFCQTAIESAAQNQEEALQMQLRQKAVYIDKLQRMFKGIESVGSGVLTLKDFESQLQDERMQAYFRLLEIHVDDAWTLFKLLDTDGTGYIDLDEFVTGCLSLRGHARAIDMAKLQYDNQGILRHLKRVLRLMEGERKSKRFAEDHDTSRDPSGRSIQVSAHRHSRTYGS